MASSHRHHHIPEMLGVWFCDEKDKKFWFVDKDDRKHGVSYRTPRGAFWKPHLNTIERSDGSRDQSAETFFSQRLEDPTSKLFQKLIPALHARKQIKLDSNSRDLLSLFHYFTYKRSPEITASISDESAELEAFREIVSTVEKDVRPLTDSEREVINSIDGYERIKKGAQIQARTMPPTPELMEAFRSIGLLFLMAEEGSSFIIGSYPIASSQLLFKKFGITQGLPISSRCLMCWTGQGSPDGISYVDNSFVRHVNELIASKSQQFAGNPRVLIESLARRLHLF